MDLLNRFPLDEQAAGDQHNKLEHLVEHGPVVVDLNPLLADGCEAAQLQLAEQASFIDTRDQAWPKHAKNLDAGSDNFFR